MARANAVSDNAKTFRLRPVNQQLTKTRHQIRKVFATARSMIVASLQLRPLVGEFLLNLRRGLTGPRSAILFQQRIEKCWGALTAALTNSAVARVRFAVDTQRQFTGIKLAKRRPWLGPAGVHVQSAANPVCPAFCLQHSTRSHRVETDNRTVITSRYSDLAWRGTKKTGILWR